MWHAGDPTPVGRGLLAALVLGTDRMITTAGLVDLLWETPPRSATAQLVLQPDFVIGAGEGRRRWLRPPVDHGRLCGLPKIAWRPQARRAEKLLLGLVSELPRKNCWTIAEHVGDATPDGLQHLLARAVWDADAVRDDLRDDLRDYVYDRLGSQGAVLIVDETGDLKKGTHTVGAQRQYTGTAGRIENAQVAVYLTGFP